MEQIVFNCRNVWNYIAFWRNFKNFSLAEIMCLGGKVAAGERLSWSCNQSWIMGSFYATVRGLDLQQLRKGFKRLWEEKWHSDVCTLGRPLGWKCTASSVIDRQYWRQRDWWMSSWSKHGESWKVNRSGNEAK